jgi:hypothetical protein
MHAGSQERDEESALAGDTAAAEALEEPRAIASGIALGT